MYVPTVVGTAVHVQEYATDEMIIILCEMVALRACMRTTAAAV